MAPHVNFCRRVFEDPAIGINEGQVLALKLRELFNLFSTLAEYERALITERVNAGLTAARRRGRKGGRPPAIDAEKVEQILAALEAGASKASVCRTFKVPRSTLIDTLRRTGWTGAGKNGGPPSV